MIQPGQHEVNIGKVFFFVILSISSFASSIIVRSAVTSILNTLSTPRRRIAATILPSTFVPIGILKLSPKVARIDGAVKKITFLLGSEIAFQTSSILLFSFNAPTGHATIHCPQPTQGELLRLFSNAQPTCTLYPLFIGPITDTDCFLQAATHLIH